ncbi:hypothetical protein CYLTODRAFT_490126 [Cylindrobasidium torrendii FP15055 ss-10]|uniref:Uncharacterized protein n=1 Tax=Cylindrobasidium torrendii FP15055 ss-10 TaxID=1314674 RepID=A0A0D7BEM9_9AGAR|nr:hypothetical protein CYLTODRAFT_490126 [Cylindrobasidium torrendii FP15055 ss-10]
MSLCIEPENDDLTTNAIVLDLNVLRLIMAAATVDDSRTVVRRLPLVSMDIRQWTEPIAYRNVIISGLCQMKSFARCALARSERDPAFYHANVKSLELRMGAYESEYIPGHSANTILRFCSGLHALRILVSGSLPDDNKIEFLNLADQHTQLKVFSTDLTSLSVGLCAPTLTHIVLNVDDEGRPLMDRNVWARILRQVPHLRLIGLHSVRAAYREFHSVCGILRALFTEQGGILPNRVIPVIVRLPATISEAAASSVVDNPEWNSNIIIIPWGLRDENRQFWTERKRARPEGIYLESDDEASAERCPWELPHFSLWDRVLEWAKDN